MVKVGRILASFGVGRSYLSTETTCLTSENGSNDDNCHPNGGLYLAKPYSAKPEFAVQESAKPYSAKPYSAKPYSTKPTSGIC